MTDDKKIAIEHGILDLIENDGRVTQTELARSLRVSIGLVNAYLKRLVKKGYVKVSNVKASTVKYMLTAEGLAQKYRLTRSYMANSLNYYLKIKKAVEARIVRLKLDEVRTVAFVGANEISEIMHLYLGETKIKLAAVFDDSKAGGTFFSHKVKPLSELPAVMEQEGIEKVLINEFQNAEDILNRLLILKIDEQMIDATW
ncbi:MAG: winged helix-turn-helix transcriptional regulator [Oligoflexia bacterium]|nr:winged helix-turn-helix transcriptional regulator [Oligoflexia bacterium]